MPRRLTKAVDGQNSEGRKKGKNAGGKTKVGRKIVAKPGKKKNIVEKRKSGDTSKGSAKKKKKSSVSVNIEIYDMYDS